MGRGRGDLESGVGTDGATNETRSLHLEMVEYGEGVVLMRERLRSQLAPAEAAHVEPDQPEAFDRFELGIPHARVGYPRMDEQNRVSRSGRLVVQSGIARLDGPVHLGSNVVELPNHNTSIQFVSNSNTSAEDRRCPRDSMGSPACVGSQLVRPLCLWQGVFDV